VCGMAGDLVVLASFLGIFWRGCTVAGLGRVRCGYKFLSAIFWPVKNVKLQHLALHFAFRPAA
jgi:hypothetical protein